MDKAGVTTTGVDTGSPPVWLPAWRDVGCAIGVFVFGVAVCLHYGRIGLFPLDQSIVFDGAWRMYRDGQIPYRDFFTPTSSVPIAIQAGLFAVFGPTWFAYCIHSAVVNGVFAVVCLALLRRLGLRTVPATMFAALTALVMYTPIGTPFGDQHAMFFTTLTFVVALLAIATPHEWAARLLWLAMPLLMALAIFSKQNPGLHSIPLGLAPLLFVGPRRAVQGGIWIAAGAVLTMTSLSLLGNALRIDQELFGQFFWRLPFAVGTERFSKVPSLTRTIIGCQLAALPAALLGLVPLLAAGLRRDTAPVWLPGWLRRSLLTLVALFFVVLIPLLCCDLLNSRIKIVVNAGIFIAVVSLCAAATAWLATSNHPSALALGRRSARCLPGVLVGITLLLLDVVCAITTGNNSQACFPHAFVAAGMVSLVMSDAGPTPGAATTGRSRLAAAWILALCVADAFVWSARFNATRYANEFFKGPPRPLAGTVLGPNYSFLRYDIPKWYSFVTNGSGRDAYVAAIDFFRTNPGTFFWMGDFTVAYAMTDRPSFSPWLWFHAGLSIPQPGTPLFQNLETELIARIRRQGCKYVVIESPETFMKMRLSDFPMLADFVARNEKERFRIEKIEIIRLY